MAPDGTEIERLAPPKDPQYDFARINREVLELESYDTAWNTWFDAQGIGPLRISYETLSANPTAALIGLCNALGVQTPNARDISPGVAKLADETSLDWMRRYRSETGSSA
ncbi:MAG: Stf0 family sulfotransferase [Aestuariivirga sp.]|nr:Stf0 family sulfotransferase [Aestuariivirga sp.]